MGAQDEELDPSAPGPGRCPSVPQPSQPPARGHGAPGGVVRVKEDWKGQEHVLSAKETLTGSEHPLPGAVGGWVTGLRAAEGRLEEEGGLFLVCLLSQPKPRPQKQLPAPITTRTTHIPSTCLRWGPGVGTRDGSRVATVGWHLGEGETLARFEPSNVIFPLFRRTSLHHLPTTHQKIRRPSRPLAPCLLPLIALSFPSPWGWI